MLSIRVRAVSVLGLLHTSYILSFLMSLCSCCYVAIMLLGQDVHTANITT